MPSLRRILLFLLLGFVDLSLSWLLFTHQNGSMQITEGNPLALKFFTTHGWVGLAMLKACCTAGTLGICFVIARYRKKLADHVLYLGIVVVAGVLVYSCVLTTHLGLTNTSSERVTSPPTLSREEAETALSNMRRRLTAQLIRGECTLTRAVCNLEYRLSRAVVQPEKVRQIELANPGIAYVQCLHSLLLEDALIELQSWDPVKASRITSRLVAEYRTYWGEPLLDLDELANRLESPPFLKRPSPDLSPTLEYSPITIPVPLLYRR